LNQHDEAVLEPQCMRTRERRQFTWRTVALGYTRSRRRQQRRDLDTVPVFVDWHHPWLFFLATGTMLLSSMDAFFTLQLIARGAIEVNPVMALALEYGHGVFAATKMVLTAVPILVLVYLSRTRFFNFVRTGLILTMSFTIYACLVCYQFVLLMQRM
jgi:hypothetical protein